MYRWSLSQYVPLNCTCILIGIAIGDIAVVQAESPAPLATSRSASTGADAWPRFHGTFGYGDVTRGSLPRTWTADNYAWSLDLGGTDVGSPVATEKTGYLVDAKTQKPTSDATVSTGTIDFVAIDLETGKELCGVTECRSVKNSIWSS